jgi:hypothetical protein
MTLINKETSLFVKYFAGNTMINVRSKGTVAGYK